ncbi:MAG TPA: hypothetical protein VHP33_05445 [Polyangiaceae bacterium]|nr:hypothetical protein [Polyangiaceae bacterium]
MRGAAVCLFFGAVLGCAGASPASPAPSAPAGAPATAAPTTAAPTQRAPASLEKTFTGQAQPSLTIKNGLTIAQHVFVDWTERAVLAPGASQTFELLVGTHTVTCADSADPDDHPAAITESIEAGYAYAYELRPGL